MLNRARATVGGLVAAAVLGGTPLSGCSSRQVENVGSTEQALGGDTNLGVASQTTVAFGSGLAGQPVVVVGYNDGRPSGVLPLDVDKVAKWATSVNGGTSFSTFSEVANPWAKTATQRPIMSDGSRYHSTRSDPAVVFTGWPGIFAYITTASSDNTFNNNTNLALPMDVVMAVSKDNGMHFGPATPGNPPIVVLSTHDSSGAAGSNRVVDQPHVYAEDPRTHVAWVAWANPDIGGCGTQNWIKRLRFLSNGTIEPSPINEIRIDCNFNCVWFDTSTIAAYCDPFHLTDDCGGTGGGGIETVLISFPRVNNGITGGCWVGGNTMLSVNMTSCTGQKLDVQYKVAISQNPATLTPTEWKQGVSGSDGSAQMNEDPVWPQCAVPNPPAFGVNNRSRPVIVHDDLNSQWHVYYTKETFNGLPPNTDSGLRVFHSQFNDQFTQLAAANEELAPVVLLPGHPGPCSDGVHECFINQFQPSASYSKNGTGPSFHVASWYDTRLDPITPRGAVWAAISKTNGNIHTFTMTQELDQAAPFAPWPFSGTNGNTPWGDYDGMASDNAGNFFPAWSDNRDQTIPTSSQVVVRKFTP